MAWPWPKGCPECATIWAAECRFVPGTNSEQCRMVCPECGFKGPMAEDYQRANVAWNKTHDDRRKLGTEADPYAAFGKLARERIAKRLTIAEEARRAKA